MKCHCAYLNAVLLDSVECDVQPSDELLDELVVYNSHGRLASDMALQQRSDKPQKHRWKSKLGTAKKTKRTIEKERSDYLLPP